VRRDCTHGWRLDRTQRRSRKNSSSMARHASSSTPATTSQRWLRRSSCGML